MKVVGICGSPREGGSEYLIKRALNELENEGIEVKLITVRENKIEPCNHCGLCENGKGECSIKDDWNKVKNLLKESDGIIIASPTYFGSISAQTKAIIDRCQSLIMKDINVFKGKVGMSIMVGGDRCGGQELGIQQINTFYLLNGIIPVSGGAFGANLGACLWSQDSGADGIKNDTYGLNTLNMTLDKFKDFLIHFKNCKN